MNVFLILHQRNFCLQFRETCNRKPKPMKTQRTSNHVVPSLNP